VRVAAVTIGQSPRSDIIPELVEIWGGRVDVVERGALDGLTREEIEEFAPAEGDYTLVTRLADGSSVTVAKRYILPRIVEALRELDAQAPDCIILLCTGDFPAVSTSALLVKPDVVLHSAVSAIAADRKVGVMTPSPLQIEQAKIKWSRMASQISAASASPYSGDEDELLRAAMKLKSAGAEIIVMDCMGYTLGMKRAVQHRTGLSVILARSLVARIAAEMLR